MSAPLRINTPGVTHQNIDGEVIILNLNNGSYYSLAGSAATLWAWCENASEQQLIEAAQTYFTGDAAQIERETREFLAQLQTEELLVPHESSNAPSTQNVAADAEAFQTPKAEKFDDLADLLLIDPIHDVDAAGWPMPQGPLPTHKS